ncbi:MAG: 50S ribosomal protein L4 [Flavobacteriales bacterium CG18_big_fil_WC_8_21_14_2_50_32_9]|jgi:large subunit ribosomal protein L4|nr:50S ribosomal protein L4 [Vicingaceae bacterium]NCP46262.1 50S ribosomal protein L4 [Flavobacteriales bacterium]PIQ14622.1 MAG: 50S ribosomal protein L4 [Flavobacteriales bacterium CG18_big_fil_WC_8_21_14_2_50_32_9]PIZ05800.1 MAG: 50S ribosomal protein L4 [Flavobacteriales bacterium CG_4_10_14_0_8_um_filter_32_5]PJC62531.1 MAG: 50S ribosomal protein L4 [Flavobacteriales bacterium CG_4_9_14_0_2_um_filter_32_27]
MELVIKNISGKDTKKKASLDETVFAIEPNDHAIYLDVKQHLANKRQGTHKSKERGEVKGSTRKIKKQKGTGTARAGNIRNPLFKGGGRVFGPRPRDYEFKLNIKQKRLARKSALSYKIKEGVVSIVEDFTFDAPKTKQYTDFLTNFDSLNKKSLLIIPESNKNVYLSSRNLQGVKVVMASEINTYDLMNAKSVIISEGSISKIEGILRN